ncbi:MAG: cytochrome c biogenesis CcdA family protein [Firmicutes bacterium]|jgi:cytochrome c biogenesis protein CcdA|nr:cytochrome c biogenesis CcdA family protein [Bacillota bacterium]
MGGFSLPHPNDISAAGAVLVAFIGGILSSASPCVLAALPAACAVTSAVPVHRRMLTALSFTAGTTTSLSALGALSAFLGRSLALGMRQASIGFGALLVVAGLLVTGWVGPLQWNACALVSRRATCGSAFLFGFLFGTVLTPCATPMLAAIVGFLAAGAQPLRGVVLMTAYSLGHCALIFAAALSWGLVEASIRRFATGIDFARKATGVLMCIAGAYLIYMAA